MRGYRSERAAMRQALRSALREARAGLRIRRAATLSAPTPPAPDIPVLDPCGAEMRAADIPAPVARSAPPSGASGVERTAPADGSGLSVLTRLLQTEAAPRPPPQPEPASPEPASPEPVAQAPAAVPPPEHQSEIALPLARLGFGAGMSARLNQLGIRDTADLAAVDPAGLREALGEISRLVDIDSWVAHARALNATR